MREWRDRGPLSNTTIWGDASIIVFAWAILAALTAGGFLIYSTFRRSGLSSWIHLTMGEAWSELVGFVGLVGVGVAMLFVIMLATFASISDEDQ